MERFELYKNFLVAKSQMEEVPVEEVDAVFKRNLPSNDLEISQMINNLSDYVDTETLISQLSFIKDASEIVELKKVEEEAKPKDPYDNLFKTNEIVDSNSGLETTTVDNNLEE